MSNLYALLIGIDDYDDRARNGIRYPKLAGCVRDIDHVQAFLRDDLRVPDENILKLTAPRAGAGAAVGDWPTYPAMVAAFRRILSLAREPGDRVYIHYSGHGGRAASIWPELKGEGAFDEALVPVDIGSEEGQYLRDVEMHALIEALIEKGLEVTVVFDSCHSGGATRGDEPAQPRGIEEPDLGPRPHTNMAADPATLAALWQAESGSRAAGERAAKPASGWLLEPRRYTFIGACRANESAFEYAFDGSERNGALTYYLLETLRRSGPSTTWRDLMDRVIGRVHGFFEKQTPQPQGELDRLLFASEELAGTRGIRVLSVAQDGNSVRLQAGEAHGLAPGARLNLFPYGADRTDPSARAALLEITRVESVESTASVLEANGPVEPGSIAILVGAADVRARRPVGIALAGDGPRAVVEQAIAAEGQGFVVVAQPGEARAFQIGPSNDGLAWEVWDAAGAPLAHVPSVPAGAPDSAARLVQMLTHIARFRTVQELSPPDGPAAGWLRVALVDPPARGGAGDPSVYRPGDTVKLQVTNLRSPGAANDPALVLNIAVLDLGSDWSIAQVYPAEADFEPLDPGRTITLEFEAYLPDGARAVEDTLKVLATRATTDFRWMELPPLGEPIQPKGPRSGADDADPLGALYDLWSSGAAGARAVRLHNAPGRDWTTGDVQFRVEREAGG